MQIRQMKVGLEDIRENLRARLKFKNEIDAEEIVRIEESIALVSEAIASLAKIKSA